MTQGSDSDALQKQRIIVGYKCKPGPKPKPVKMTIKKFERMLKK